jgi:hypothetical protein
MMIMMMNFKERDHDNERLMEQILELVNWQALVLGLLKIRVLLRVS